MSVPAATPTTVRKRGFTPLALQPWCPAAMSYLRELDALQTRRDEVLHRRGGNRQTQETGEEKRVRIAKEKAKAKAKAGAAGGGESGGSR